ncbi:MAG: helix-turn-helix domain-containing protein [Oscillospiraceae bacterium]|nr:helix-turn-helix domain-containing protein [Oscillospiraceae bacterium]
MEIGSKIKQLRYKCGLTQEQLAARLGISAQSVSKWENAVAMPDITLLPLLAEVFGVSIDELFDLTVEQKLKRIENRMNTEEEFPEPLFKEYEEFLTAQLTENKDRTMILWLLARLYHHRMEADARRVSKYAREAIMLAPAQKECQWLLQMAEGDAPWDWNIANHAGVINFYKSVIANDKGTPKTPLPYYYLIDDLIADRRTEEAREYVEKCAALPAHKPFLLEVYRAHIALAEYDEAGADGIMEAALEKYGDNSGFLFETAQYYAKKCDYEKAVEFYEKSWASEEDKKPRYTDALQGIALIYEIIGDSEKAAETYDRWICCLREEWGFAADDRAVVETEREKARVLQK